MCYRPNTEREPSPGAVIEHWRSCYTEGCKRGSMGASTGGREERGCEQRGKNGDGHNPSNKTVDSGMVCVCMCV